MTTSGGGEDAVVTVVLTSPIVVVMGVTIVVAIGASKFTIIITIYTIPFKCCLLYSKAMACEHVLGVYIIMYVATGTHLACAIDTL